MSTYIFCRYISGSCPPNTKKLATLQTDWESPCIENEDNVNKRSYIHGHGVILLENEFSTLK